MMLSSPQNMICVFDEKKSAAAGADGEEDLIGAEVGGSFGMADIVVHVAGLPVGWT